MRQIRRRLANQIQKLEQQLEPTTNNDLTLHYSVNFDGFLQPEAVLSVRFRFSDREEVTYKVQSVRHIKEDGGDLIEAKLVSAGS